jgi:transcriptional regulator GlxA family with amidase domain
MVMFTPCIRFAMTSRKRSVIQRPTPQRWEVLRCEDGLDGPAAAIADMLRLVNEIATLRGARHDPVSLAHRTPAGRTLKPPLIAVARPRSTGRSTANPKSSASLLPDVLIIPGWHARNGPRLNRLVNRDRMACARLRAVHDNGGHVVGLFTGVALLGEAGLLDQARAVIPWPFVPAVLRHAPGVKLVNDEALIEHERVWTVDSPILATEAALLVMQAAGLAELAESARAVLLHSPQRQSLTLAVAEDARTRVGPGSLERARRWLEDHLHEPYSLADTARAAATSERSLLRHFRQTFGQTPLQMLHGLRVTRARMLLETTYLSTEAIAERCGWRDPVMLRDVFRRSTGLTPAAYRERYRLRTKRREWGSDLS